MLSPNGEHRLSINGVCRVAINTGSTVNWESPNAGVVGGCSSGYLEVMANGSLRLFASPSSSTPLWNNAVPAGASATAMLTNAGVFRILTHGQRVAWNTLVGATGIRDDTVTIGSTLQFGQALYSANGQWTAFVGLDGILRVTTASGSVKWSSSASPTAARTLQVRASDSSILLLSPSLASTWASGTAGMIGTKLVLGNSGVLRYYGVVGQLWNSTINYAGLITWHMPNTVGVYAYGSSSYTSCPYYSQPLCDGWPIIGITGGLGTSSAPWVSTAGSSDYDTGLAIQNSGRAVPWLSFWTVSGPSCSEHGGFAEGAAGYLAGRAVAQKIDSYDLAIKPTYVILDPEGYPDDHSGLDCRTGPGGSVSQADRTAWHDMLTGWLSGLTSVDGSLHGAVYSDQGEYADYQLGTLPIPSFLAVAFGYSGNPDNPLVAPSPISSAIPYGAAEVANSNVKGVIAFYVGVPFNLECGWNSVAAQDLANWGGPLNTLQFDPGTTCPA
jgi:hypothetical protein